MAELRIAAAFLGILAASPALAAGGSGAPVAPVIDVSGLPASAVARPDGPPDQPHPAEARLLFEPAVAVPGEVVSIGVHLAQDPEWHSYWRSPGDIGLPTNIALTLPEGAVVRPRVWPVPERFEASDIVSFGYDREVLHIVDVELPATLPPGEHPIRAEVEWLVCKTACIPGSVTLERTLTVGRAGQHGPYRALFDHYRARHPDPMPAAVRAEVVACRAPAVANGKFRYAVSVHPAEGHTLTRRGGDLWPTFTPDLEQSAQWMYEDVRVRADGEGFTVTLAGLAFEPDGLPQDDRIGGLVQVDVDGRPAAFDVHAPLAWGEAGTPVVEADDPRCAAIEAPAVAQAPAPDEHVPAVAEAPARAPVNEAGLASWSAGLLLTNLLLAFVGGLILNVMPCVLPVLTLKLYGLVDQAGTSAGERRQAGLMYTAGIVSSFLALAMGVEALRTLLGEDVAWGYQMQYPGYVAGLATAVFVFGLSLFGVFEIPAFGTRSAHDLSSREGPAGYFFTGVFATLVATPCSAPFLGTATAFAFQAPTALLLVMFAVIGLGLASPFLLVAFVPRAYDLLPKPGAWMETFKQLLGFTLIATTIWLVGVLFGLVGSDAGLGFLAFLGVVALGAWIFGRFGGVAADGLQQVRALALAGAVVGLGGFTFLELEVAPPETCDDGPVPTSLAYDQKVPWQRFSPERVEELRGRVLFVDFTADWCVSCKVNEKTVLETATVREAMARYDVVPLKADFTRKDPVIKAWLDRFGRAGVPMYLVIPPSGVEDAVLLPEVITPSMVVEALRAAAEPTLGRR